MATRHWITEDFFWKLLSLLLAVAIWLIVHKIVTESGAASTPVTGDKQTYYDVPVQVVSEVVSAGAGLGDLRVTPGTVAVTVSGTPAAMAFLQANQIRAIVDATDLSSQKAQPLPVEVTLPAGVALVSVNPDHVKVAFPPSPPKNDESP